MIRYKHSSIINTITNHFHQQINISTWNSIEGSPQRHIESHSCIKLSNPKKFNTLQKSMPITI